VDGSALTEARRLIWSARAGILGPIWFWATLIALALLHGRIEISGHQLLRYGIVMYIGFFGYGVLTLIMVTGLRRRLPRRRRSTVAVVALMVLACGPLLATFTMEGEPGPPRSWPAWLHMAGFALISLVPIVALPLFGSAVWSDARWRPIGPVSVAWGVVVAVVVFLPSAPAEGYAIWLGPSSLVDIALIGAWQIVVAIRLGALARAPVSRRGDSRRRTAENYVM
jgi:hypothetical protein